MVACSEGEQSSGRQRPPAPVEVAPIETGTIRGQRTFSGALEASEAFTVSPKVGGRIDELRFDLGDIVPRNAVVARLDDAEFQQEVARAEAELMVARANFAESESSLTLTRRSIRRSETLRERGVASEAELDTARSELLAQEARVEVFRAEIARAEAALEAARIQLSYTNVQARWRGPGDERRIARRCADEGQNINANADLLEIVEIDPMVAVFFVTERDYPGLRLDQPVDLRTDAFPGRTFTGNIARIAPVFDTNTRQARVEVRIENSDRALKPGMFVRADVEVARADDATIVPYAAMERRSDETGIFIVSEDGSRAHWRPVQPGIREGNRLQVTGKNLHGRVIILGQQLVEDGSEISVADRGESLRAAGSGDGEADAR
jgi:RND family efflux transporter MFP subunit